MKLHGMEYDDMYASVLTTEGMIGILLDTFFFQALIDRKLHIYWHGFCNRLWSHCSQLNGVKLLRKFKILTRGS